MTRCCVIHSHIMDTNVFLLRTQTSSLPSCLITSPGKHFITRRRLGSASHTRISSALCIFIWADYYAGSSPGALLCPFQYTDPAIHKGSTSACDAEHTRLCAGSSQGDVCSRWVPGTDGQGSVLFLTALLLCRHGAFTREDICIGNVFYFIKAFGPRHQTEFGGERWCCPHRVGRREKGLNYCTLCILMQSIKWLDCALKMGDDCNNTHGNSH